MGEDSTGNQELQVSITCYCVHCVVLVLPALFRMSDI